MENNEDLQQDLFSNEIDPYFQHTHATQGQRFLNYFIDNLIMRFTITYVTGYGAGYILGFLFPEFMLKAASYNNTMTLILLAYVIGCLIT